MTPQNDTPWWDTDTPKEDDTPWWDRPAAPSATYYDEQYTESNDETTQAPSASKHPETWRRILLWANRNIHTVIYMAIGLCFAIGILKIGFWRTFLVALCLGIGYVLGSWHDGNPRLIRRIKNFSRRFLDDNPFINKHN